MAKKYNWKYHFSKDLNNGSYFLWFQIMIFIFGSLNFRYTNLYMDQCKYIYKHISSKNALLSNDRYTNTYFVLTGRHRLTTILH